MLNYYACIMTPPSHNPVVKNILHDPCCLKLYDTMSIYNFETILTPCILHSMFKVDIQLIWFDFKSFNLLFLPKQEMHINLSQP